jgi:hypothetical protein
MLPVMRDEPPGMEPFIKPHIVVKLKPGWAFDPSRRAFVSPDGDLVRPRRDLPKGSRIVPMAPELTRDPRAARSTAEKELSRYFQVILPKGEDASAALDAANHWPGIAEASMPPKVSLPGVV